MMNSFLDKAVVPITSIPGMETKKMNMGGELTKDDMLSTPPPMFMNFGGGLPAYQTLDYTQMDGKEVVPFTKERPLEKFIPKFEGIERITEEVEVPRVIQAKGGVMNLPISVQRPISAGKTDIQFMNFGGMVGSSGLMGLMNNTNYDI
jgi:hypothetical protein|tara:strand:- start:35 stop:478 length:444 start_codon:yes stop_codon:yes gene_type:complete